MGISTLPTVSWVCTLCQQEGRLWAQNQTPYQDPVVTGTAVSDGLSPCPHCITCEFQHSSRTGVRVWFQEQLSFVLLASPEIGAAPSEASSLCESQWASFHGKHQWQWDRQSSIFSKWPRHTSWGSPCHVNKNVWALSHLQGFLLCERGCLVRCSFLECLFLCRWIIWVLLAWEWHREPGLLAASISAAAALTARFPDGDSVTFSPG